MTRRHPFTIGRTVLLTALLCGVLTWLRVGDDEGDGAVILPLLALPARPTGSASECVGLVSWSADAYVLAWYPGR